MIDTGATRQRLPFIAVLVLIRLALPLAWLDSSWEYHRDELLYFAMGDHLAWRMQFPPLVPAVAALSTAIFGDAVWSARVPAAVAGAALTLCVLLLVQRFGGGRRAMAWAWVALLAAPVFLRPSVLFQPVIFDQLWATLAVGALMLAAHERRPQWWMLAGVGFGLGFLTKFSVLLYGVSAALVALAHPALRQQLRTRWPWAALGLALLCSLPALVGQVHFGWPFLQSLAALQAGQFAETSVAGTLSGQVLMLGSGVLIAAAGFWCAVRRTLGAVTDAGRVAVGFLVVLLGLVLWQGGKEYYVAPAYPALIAVGALVFATYGKVLQRALAVVITGGALVLLPLGVPMLPPAQMAAYAGWLGLGTETNWGETLELPQDYADMLGWQAQAEAVSRAFAALSPADQSVAVVSASNYGEAGALARYAPRYGYPYPVSTSGDFHAWGLYGRSGEVAVLLEGPDALPELEKLFREVVQVDSLGDPRAVPEERDIRIYVARGPRVSIPERWWAVGAEWQ